MRSYLKKISKLPHPKQQQQKPENILHKIQLILEITYFYFFVSLKFLKLQERVLNNVVIYLLGDEDPRVRHVAAASLTRCLPVFIPLFLGLKYKV